MRSREEVAIVGYAGRVPGAANIDAFWSTLRDNRSSVSWISPDRFPTGPYYHPSPNREGRSYTFAAGLIDDVWGFDASAFGMSPREAEQVDPQQRHLLEVTYDALAHAGIRPSSLAGSTTGVYVGASSIDYGARFIADPSAADVHMMSGNTLSVISNRISYNLDLRGPSLTIDTACSSSLVALSVAAEAIRNGTIDTAIVAGVNLLLSPFSFIGFSRASMLSPTGRCRPFAADADGYVRSEGVIVLVLRAMGAARKARDRIHASIVGSGVGQDGRTAGLSLPSAEAQRNLLEQVYSDFGVDPTDLAFVEAHGTGTKVGDPMEADALGRALAQKRTNPLVIGSVKSNIGHLEPASGLAGVLKTVLALNHGILPATLYQELPSSDISFEELNLNVVARNHPLGQRREALMAGVNSFGFGGTIAHVILRGEEESVSVLQRGEKRPATLLVTANSTDGVTALAASYLNAWPRDDRAAFELVGAAAHSRDVLSHRALVHGRTVAELRYNLARFVGGVPGPDIRVSQAIGRDLDVGFIFSGNGSQWAGMGRAAWTTNRTFQEALRDVDQKFSRRQDWSLVELLLNENPSARLRLASFAQPLLFALQVATVRTLEEIGIVPVATLGHSVGEIAAAWTAGALSLDSAIDIVIARSRHQESARGMGGMAALLLSERDTRHFLESAQVAGVSIAAINSWRSVTVSGPWAAIDRLLILAHERKISARRLDLDYPFHHALINAVRAPLLRELEGLKGQVPRRRFISSVTGTFVDHALDPQHWWRNVRDPVQFEAGVNSLLDEGIRVIVEVGPRPILASYVRDTLRNTGIRGAVVETLTEKTDSDVDPLQECAKEVLLTGGRVDFNRFFGSPPAMSVPQPSYPWKHTQYKVGPTSEASSFFVAPSHPLLGTRQRADSSEWFATIDPELFPWLGDHQVEQIPVFPAAAYVEVLLAAAREVYEGSELELRELDIFRPIVFDGSTSIETRLRIASETGVAELHSRVRGGTAEWLLNARGVVVRTPIAAKTTMEVASGPVVIQQLRVYELSRELGFGYGKTFQRIKHVSFPNRDCAVAELTRASDQFDRYLSDLTALDAAFHALFASEEAGVSGPLSRMLPTRFGRVQLCEPGARASRVVARTIRRTDTSIVVDIELYDHSGRLLMLAQGVRLIEVPVAGLPNAASFFYTTKNHWLDRPGSASPLDLKDQITDSRSGELPDRAAASDSHLLIEAACLQMAWTALNQSRSGGLVGEASGPADGDGETSGSAYLNSALSWHLEAKGLSKPDGNAECELPDASDVVRSLLSLHPTMTAEAAILSRLTEALPDLLAGAKTVCNELTSAHWHDLSLASGQIGLLRRSVIAQAQATLELVDKNRLLRVLVLGADHLSAVRELFDRFPSFEYVVTDLDSRRVDQARALDGDRDLGIRFVSWGELGTLQAATFDLVLAIDALSAVTAARDGLSPITRILRPKAPLIAGELQPSIYWDMVRGVRPSWWARSTSAEFPVGTLLSDAEWVDELRTAGLSSITAEAVASNGDAGIVIRAAAAITSTKLELANLAPLEWEGAETNLTLALREAVNNRRARSGLEFEGTEPEEVSIVTLDAQAEATLDSLSAQLAIVVERFSGSSKSLSLWILVDCGNEHHGAPLAHPTWCAITAAMRVAANELPTIRIRCLGIAGAVNAKDIESVVEDLVAPTDEREIFYSAGRRLVTRIERGIRQINVNRTRDIDEVRTVLHRGATRGNLEWANEDRPIPGSGEVAIEVKAVGLNFRDVMWNLGLLPEEALEDGFAGPTLGMECSGVVVALGDNVKGFAIGDRVLAFASGAFASHVVIPTIAAVHLPHSISFEAAATLPVAFLTAYYSLVELARVREGETVLIHGGAGAVGLAALQVAKLCGARVVATAGSEEKRALLRTLGADLVLNSRTLTFADEVRAWSGGGVDTVLNSLAGEAMIRSIDCLRPFGRFVELGKRDYYSNTYVGLRPFRLNLAYFGVDVDQMIRSDSPRLRDLLNKIMGKIETGQLATLPHRVFSAGDIHEAFRLMQRSGHVGKIVITAPKANEFGDTYLCNRFKADPHGTHVVIGGSSGFGFETARWLVGRGARHLVLASRSGRLSEETTASIEEMRGGGINVDVLSVDVADEEHLSAALQKLNSARPIKGIVHAAMVLDDGSIESMDVASIRNVLTPKVAGALNLERLAKGLNLDFLLLYSSATTLMGNPGQFNYVAANAFLEGVARRARNSGVPALSISWGGISDAGYLSRHMHLNPTLKRRFTGNLMTAQEALDAIDQAWSTTAAADVSSLCVARIDWTAAWRNLDFVHSPVFSRMLLGTGDRLSRGSNLSLEALGAMDLPEATASILEMIVQEISSVLRLPPKEVDCHKPLAEIGMDSLMMLELRLKVEAALQIDLPMMSLASGITPADVARRVATLIVEGEQKGALSGTLAALSGSHVATETDAAGIDATERAVRAVVDSSRSFLGPL